MPANCLKCDAKITECDVTKCETGYYLTATKLCLPCASGCSVCTDSTGACTACTDGTPIIAGGTCACAS